MQQHGPRSWAHHPIVATAVAMVVLDQATKALATEFLSGHLSKLFGPVALQLIYDPKTSFSFVARGSRLCAFALWLRQLRPSAWSDPVVFWP